jgi:hypothetical protein
MRRTVIAVSLALGVVATGVLAAQADVPSNPNILAAIQSLRADLVTAFNGMSQKLTAIQTTLNALIPAPTQQSNILMTPPVQFGNAGSNSLGCDVLNKSAEPKTVVVTGIGSQGVEPVSFTPPAGQTVAPGQFLTFSVFVANPFAAWSCVFTVVNGTRNDILASGSQRTDGIVHSLIAAQ